LPLIISTCYNTLIVSVPNIIWNIPGGNFSIVGGHRLFILSKMAYMYMCPILNGFQDRAISLNTSKFVDKKEILCSASNTDICCSVAKLLQLT
jgi:hypothetical protein